jgi:hypothetical protein
MRRTFGWVGVPCSLPEVPGQRRLTLVRAVRACVCVCVQACLGWNKDNWDGHGGDVWSENVYWADLPSECQDVSPPQPPAASVLVHLRYAG